MVYYKDTTNTNAINCLQELLKTTTSIDLLLGTKKLGTKKDIQENSPFNTLFFQAKL